MSGGERVRFTLFVSGRSPRTETAIVNLRRICDEVLGGSCDVTIVDALEQPELAEAQKILATPTLIRESPAPRRRVTGDLSDPGRVVQMLMLSDIGRDAPGGHE